MMYIADSMVSAPRPPSSQPTTSSPEPDTGLYTIDELAAQARVPSRTIRFYQSKGALMAPEIRGRVAYYGKQHEERLRLIAQLQERGLRIDAIRGLVQSIERGELDLAEWLGVEQQLTASWSQDQARTMGEAELLELLGRERRPGMLADLMRLKLIERRGDVYLVESPALLSMAIKLEAAGVDPETARDASDILRKHLGRAVAELTELLLRRARAGFVETSQPAKLFAALRPVGIEAVRILFAKQAEGALRKLLESGVLTTLSQGKRRSKRR
jgi:DNA-binding transcriptional MerR regulator